MQKSVITLLFPMLLASCVAPINTTYESARMLGKGEIEVTGNYSHYSASSEGESDAVNNNFGVRLGYGINNKINLKLRYEGLISTYEDADMVNYLDIAPKFQIIEGKIAATLPLGLYFTGDDSKFVISPKFMFTYPANDKFEVTLATKADIFPEDESNVYLGFNLGLGISSDLNRWAIRPEAGLMIDPNESGVYWAFGVGIVGVISGRNGR